MSELLFCHATPTDWPEILAIYNSTIASRMVTADTEPATLASKQAWFAAHNTSNRPLWVVYDSERVMVGWISFQSFYGRKAYEATAEVSIYLHPDFRGKGLGKQFLAYAIAQAPNLGIKTLLGFIFSHNLPSLQVFYGLGFSRWGELPNVAELDGNSYSLSLLGKRVGED